MKAVLSPQLAPIVTRIHQAAGNAGAWDEVLTDIRDHLGASMAVLGRYHFPSASGSKLTVTPPNDAFQSEYEAGYAIRNPWFIASREYRRGRVMTGDELMRPEELVRTDFYQHFLSKYRLHHRLCGVLSRTGDTTVYLALYRPETATAFSEEHRHALLSVICHLAPALENHWGLLHFDSMNRIMRSVLDDFGPAVFLVDSDGELLFASGKAQNLLDDGRALACPDGRIKASNRFEDRTLREAISRVATHAPVDEADAPPTEVIPLSSTGHNHPLMLSVHAAGHLFSTESNSYLQSVMLVVKSPDAVHNIEQCTFTQAYHLTDAQARLTGLLLAGYSLNQAADFMTISDNTARSHLKQVFNKTGTHSQMELVHLHARVCTDYF